MMLIQKHLKITNARGDSSGRAPDSADEALRRSTDGKELLAGPRAK
jgi:hypothetical protein